MGSATFLSFFAIVIGIPVLASYGYRAWRDHVRLKEKQLEAMHGADNPEGVVARMERMEERLRVLERILTDRGHHLAEEIERLRDR